MACARRCSSPGKTKGGGTPRVNESEGETETKTKQQVRMVAQAWVCPVAPARDGKAGSLPTKAKQKQTNTHTNCYLVPRVVSLLAVVAPPRPAEVPDRAVDAPPPRVPVARVCRVVVAVRVVVVAVRVEPCEPLALVYTLSSSSSESRSE